MLISGTTSRTLPSLYQPSSRMMYAMPYFDGEVDVVLVGLGVDAGLEVHAVELLAFHQSHATLPGRIQDVS